MVETTSSVVGGLVDVNMIRDLPLNARSFQQLVTLQAGAFVVKDERPDLGTGKGERINVSGARAIANAYMLDGADIRDMMGQAPVAASGNMLGVEGIREFAVLTSNFSAEYGGAGGAVINIVTRSGTNDFHGALFEFHRNSILDAKNFFDKLDEPIPPFKRNQFGAAIGGPIAKDQTFFFFNYEGLRERLGVTQVGRVPDENARRGLIPEGGSLKEVGVHPAVRPYLDLYPRPNGRNFGDGIAEYLSFAVQPTTEDYIMSRIDHKLSDSDSIFGRYVFDDGSMLIPEALNLVPRDDDSRQQYLTVEEDKILTANLVNVFRFSLTRSVITGFNRPVFSEALGRALAFTPVFPFAYSGLIGVGGLSALGGASNYPKFYGWNVFQWSNNLTYTKGSHSIKTGFEAKRYQINMDSCSQCSGNYTFDTLERFLAARPRSFSGLIPGLDTVRYIRWSTFGMFLQDDWKITGRFALNLGLRYDFMTLPFEKFGKMSNWRHALDPGPTLGPLFRNPTLKNFQPRIGFAWDPFGGGKTSIRAAFGVFSQPFPSGIWNHNFVRQPPFFARASIANPPFPNPFAVGFRVPVNPQSIDYDVDNPTMLQYNLSIQREIFPSTVLKVAYVGSHGYHLDRTRDANMAYPRILPDGRKFFPAEARPRNPALGTDTRTTTDANSFYNSLQIEIVRRTNRGLQFQANYTLSKSIDDYQGRWDQYPGVGSIQDADDRKGSRGLSAFDVRHKFVLNYGYDLPFGPGKAFGANLAGFYGWLISGWRANGITTIAAGRPITIELGFRRSRAYSVSVTERPNLKPGASNNPVLGGPDRYYDPNAFELQPAGFFGNLGRNTLIGPGLVNFDFSLFKSNKIGEGKEVQFRMEVFNIFNRPNFGEPDGVVFRDATGKPAPQAGRINRTVTTSRQIQFALKFTF